MRRIADLAPMFVGHSSASVFLIPVTIRACRLDDDIATFKNNTWPSGRTLELADGRIFRVATNFWQTKFGFETES